MTSITRHLSRSIAAAGVVAGLCAAMFLATAGQAAGGKTQTLRFYDKVVSVQVTKADGTVVAKPPFPEPGPGDTLDVVSHDFAGTHAKHARQAGGSSHLRCVFPATPGPPDCVSHVAFGSSMLVFEGNPGKVILGTGKYLGAKGRVLSSTTIGGGNDSDVVARVTLR
jgi:hypothetical protein